MPVNFQQALQQIREMGKQAAQEQETAGRELREEAERAVCAVSLANWIRWSSWWSAPPRRTHPCAALRPSTEFLNQTFPTPPLESRYTLLAADGSQINPDRHAMVEFGAINVGAIRMLPRAGRRRPKNWCKAR